MAPSRVAVVGGGVAGLLSAWGLSGSTETTLFEAKPRLGGSVRTLTVDVQGRPHPVETGFQQFTTSAFPAFVRLLDALGVERRPHAASITVARRSGAPFFWPPRLGSLRRLGHTAAFVRMLGRCRALVDRPDPTLTMAEWAAGAGLSRGLLDEVLYPFLATSRSLAPGRIPELAALPLLGYLDMPGRERPPAWSVVDGGASRYIEALVARLDAVTIHTGAPVVAIRDAAPLVEVVTASGRARFDAVVVATDAGPATDLLADHPGAAARAEALARLTTYPVVNLVHGDARLAPVRRSAWSQSNVVPHGDGWAFTSWEGRSTGASLFRSYTTGPVEDVRDVHDITWQHLSMTPEVAAMQEVVERDQGRGGLWLAGTFTTGIDSHESAVVSARRVVRGILPDGPLPEGLA